MKRVLASIVTSVACCIGALCGGCAIAPAGPGSATINDTNLTNDVATATSLTFTGVSLKSPEAAQPMAREAYEIATAINSAAKAGTTLGDAQSLVKSYLDVWNSPWEPSIAQLLNDVNDQYVLPHLPSSATQPSSQPSEVSALTTELLIDTSQGVMNGALPFAKATPTASLMGAEYRPGTPIVVRHFAWKPR